MSGPGSIRPAFHDDDAALSRAATFTFFGDFDPKSIATTAFGAPQQMLKIRDENGPGQSAPALKHAVRENHYTAAWAFHVDDPSFKVQEAEKANVVNRIGGDFRHQMLCSLSGTKTEHRQS